MKNIINNIIKQVFNTKTYKTTKIENGLNNHNFLIEIKQQKYVLRIPFEHNNFNRENEFIIQNNCPLSITPPCIFFDPKSGIKIVEYINNSVTFKNNHSKDNIKQIARIIKTFHKLPKTNDLFLPSKKLIEYKKQIKKEYFNDLKNFDVLINFAKAEERKNLRMCHNDLVEGNFLFSKSKVYIIDFEYACTNNYLFDIASFISENNLTPNEKTIFLNHYFNNKDIPLNEINKWIDFNNLLWCYWGLMMYEKERKIIYFNIAEEKFNNLKKGAI